MAKHANDSTIEMPENTSASTSVKSNFGPKGWNVIALCTLMLFFSTSTTTDGLNVTVDALAELHGWEPAVLLGFSTITGLVSIIGMYLFGIICNRIGARLTAAISLLLGGLSYIWYGCCSSVTQYAIALCLVSVFANVYGWIAGGAYLASWFPRKKGVALGWAGMGNNLASASIVIILTWLSSFLGGISRAIAVVGGAIAVSAVWAWFTPDSPENAGATPDNIPMTKDQIDLYRRESDAYVSPWTTRRLLRTKQFWLISLGLGLYMMVTVGVMSQLVPRLVSLGLTQNEAIISVTVCALIGIGGSYIWGVLDQKLTTRIAAAIFGIWYAAAILFNLIPSKAGISISIIMIGLAIGGNAHWPVSLVSTAFGHRNFAKVYSLINPAISIVRMCSFAVLALALALTGTMTGAYILFAVLSVLSAVLIFLMNDKEYAEE